MMFTEEKCFKTFYLNVVSVQMFRLVVVLRPADTVIPIDLYNHSCRSYRVAIHACDLFRTCFVRERLIMDEITLGRKRFSLSDTTVRPTFRSRARDQLKTRVRAIGFGIPL